MTKEKIHKESMYRVLRSLWYTKDWVNFVEIGEGTFLVKFGTMEDRERILNLSPWMFYQYILSLVPYEKEKDLSLYNFSIVPFWIRVSNVPMEMTDRQLVMEVGSAVGKVIAIDWRDRNGGWVEYMRIRVRMDTTKPLRRAMRVEGGRKGDYLCCEIRTVANLLLCVWLHRSQHKEVRNVPSISQPDGVLVWLVAKGAGATT